MLSFNYDIAEGILYVKESRNVTFKDKERYIREALNIIDQGKELKILQDSRGAKIDFSAEKIDIIRNKIVDRLKETGSRLIQAVIYDTSVETAFSYLYQRSDLPINYIHKIFNTKEAALRWLNNY
jgi:hypothetical protein